jgi:hypothetical protein
LAKGDKHYAPVRNRSQGRLIFCVLAFLCLVSCHQEGTRETKENTSARKGDSVSARGHFAAVENLHLGALESDLALMQYTHYGDFLDGKWLSFYTAGQPDFLLFGIKPLMVRLYFANGVLYRKRYWFSKDVGPEIFHHLQLDYANYQAAPSVTVLLPDRELRYQKNGAFQVIESLR